MIWPHTVSLGSTLKWIMGELVDYFTCQIKQISKITLKNDEWFGCPNWNNAKN